jgi:two-component system CheB/CheR fusion protein
MTVDVSAAASRAWRWTTVHDVDENVDPSGAGFGALITQKTGMAMLPDQLWLLDFISNLGQPVVLVDEAHRILTASALFYRLVDATPQSASGRSLSDVCDSLFEAPAVLAFLDLVHTGSVPPGGHRLEGSKGTFFLSAQRVPSRYSNGRAIIVLEGAPRSESAASPGPSLRLAEPAQKRSSSFSMANHAIRQPLQTLSLLQGLMAIHAKDAEFRKLAGRFDEALAALVGIISAATCAEQIDARAVSPELLSFPIGVPLGRLRSDFAYHAEAKGLKWRMVSSSLSVRSDSRLLAEVLRALLIYAIRLIKRGKVLFGPRRAGAKIVFQIWVRGSGVPAEAQKAILDEFHAPAEPGSPATLAQAIVKPLSDLLGLSVKCRSRPGNGLVFTAEVPIESGIAARALHRSESKGAVLVVSDDAFVRETLVLLLKELGHETVAISPGDDRSAPLGAKPGSMRPEVIVADFRESIGSVPDDTISSLRWRLGWTIPVIVLGGDPKDSLTVGEPCACLPKPVQSGELAAQLGRFLDLARTRSATRSRRGKGSLQQTIYVVDDDGILRGAAHGVLGQLGAQVASYASAEDFLEKYNRNSRGCLIVDNVLPGMKGVELLERLNAAGDMLPSIMITGHGDTASAVRALKAGAIDYMEKPVSHESLLSAVERALDRDLLSADARLRKRELTARIEELTPRERQVMNLVVEGHSSKKIADLLKISQRTVENHRAAVMRRIGASSLSQLIWIGLQLRLSDGQQGAPQ